VPRRLAHCLIGLSLTLLAGCAADHSPDIYASNAVQQANKVDTGIVIGYREVRISANGTAGAVTGGAAGGVLGSQIGNSGFDQAMGGVAGSAIGGMLGSTIEHVTGDTTGWEYIVRKPNNDLLSVTQAEAKPIAIGQKVLVISGAQARIIPDYSVDLPVEPAAARQPPVTTPAPPLTPVNAVVPAPERPVVSDLPPPTPSGNAPVAAGPAASELPPPAPLLPAPAPAAQPE
jgi:outer membrane lipoprotein SlyB